MTARPHLPSYFPDYDIYIWIDADCWVQDWRAVSMLGLAAKDYGFSVVAECDRSYFPSWDRGPFLEFNYDCLLRCFGEELAQKFRYHPTLNCGVFAATGESALWPSWARYLGIAFDRMREPFFFAEQTAMNACVRQEAIPAAILPARCNWMCSRSLPRLSFDGKILVEPQPPFESLGIIHLAADTKYRTWTIFDLGGTQHTMSLTFPMLG